MWRLAIFRTRTNQNHVCSPLSGGVYYFKLRAPLPHHCFRLLQVGTPRAQDLLGSRRFCREHLFCNWLMAHRRPQEAPAQPVNIFARPNIDHREQSNRLRLN
jgi:hypothetical protein